MKTKYFLIAAIIFLSAIVYLQINLHDQTKKELIEKFKTEQEITTRHFAEEVETFLQEETDRIKSFVLFQGLQHGKMSEIKTLVDEDFEYFKKDHVKSINVYDKNGTIIYSTNKEAIGGNNAESKFFKWATTPENKSEPFIASDSIENRNRSLQMPVFSLLIAMPVYQNVEKTVKVKSTQNMIGVVTIIIDLEETLTNLLPRISADVKKESVMILDKGGTLWYQTEHPEMVMKNIYVHDKSCSQCHNSFDYIGKMLSEKQGRIDYGLKKGPKKIASFSSFEFKNIAWTIVLNHEYSEVTRFLDQSYRQSLIIIGSIIFTLLGFTIISFRSNRLRIRAQEEATLWREKLELEEKIRESEEKFRTVVEEANEIIFTTNNEGYFTYVNPRGIKVSGYSLDELKQIKYLDIIEPEYKPIVKRNYFKQYVKRIALSTTEYPFQTKSGEIKWFSQNASLILENNMVKGFYVIARDITELRVAEQALRESEARYKELSKQLEAILDHIPGLVFYKDKKNNFIRVNKYLALAHGKEKEELEGKNLSDFYPEEDAAKYQQDDLEVINSGMAKLNIEEPWQTADGLKWVSTSKIPFAGENGEFIGIIGMSIDITERKRAEETISNEQLLLRTLIDNIPDSIYSKDLACRKTLANLTELRFMGVKSESEVLGKDDFAFYPKELADKFFADDQSVIQSGMPVLNREEYILDEKGQKRWLLTSKLPLRDKDGRIIGLIGIGRDITERRQAEENLRESEIKLKVILQSTADGILAIDSEGKVIKTNNRFAELWRIPQPLIDSGDDNALIGFVLDQLTNPDEFISKVQKLYHSMDEDLDHLQFKDGRIFERFSAPMVMDDSSIGRVWSFRDITERKRAEEALRESEEAYRALFIESKDAMMTLTPDKGFISGNPEAIRMFGCSDEKDFTSRTPAELSPEYQPDGALSTDKEHEMMMLALKKGVNFFEWTHKCINGTEFPATVLLSRIEKGGKVILQATVRDITERLRTVQEIKLKNEELQKINAEKDKFFSIVPRPA